jgi:hypothetical protein
MAADVPQPSPQPATGFWRLAQPPGAQRTWLVAPDGRCVFLLGVNAVLRDTKEAGKPRGNGIAAYIQRTDATTAAHTEWARLSTGECAGIRVARPYGFDSVGAFSETNDFADGHALAGDSFMVRPPHDGGAGAPYAVVIYPVPAGDDRALKDESGTVLRGGFSRRRIGDPYNPAFLADLDAMVERDVAPRRDDPGLQMWFCGNEAGMFDVGEHRRGGGVRDFRRWLWSDVPARSSIDRPACARHALAAFLRERYRDSIDDLNAAWESAYPSFAAIVDVGPRPVPDVHDCDARCAEDVQRFVHDGLLREWVTAVTSRVRAADPNHLVASPRLAIDRPESYRFWTGGEDHWVEHPQATIGDDACPFDLLARDGDVGFDLVAINAYTGAPRFPQPWFADGLHKVQGESGLPVIISEFGIRVKIDGWSNRGGAPSFVDSQLARGQRYESQIDQFVGFRHVVGAIWHAWSDRYMPDDERLQINMGLVQCDDVDRGFTAGERWPDLDRMVAETNRTIMSRIQRRTGF